MILSRAERIIEIKIKLLYCTGILQVFLLFIHFGCEWFLAIKFDQGCFKNSHWSYKENALLAVSTQKMLHLEKWVLLHHLPKGLGFSPPKSKLFVLWFFPSFFPYTSLLCNAISSIHGVCSWCGSPRHFSCWLDTTGRINLVKIRHDMGEK